MFPSAVNPVAAVALLAQCAAALSNTSPVMLLSDVKPLQVSGDHRLVPSMEYVFDTLAPESVRDCGYDAYIFVRHANVSERQINRASMPFLSHVAERAEGKYIQGTAVDGAAAGVDAAIAELKTSIETRCGAMPVALDAAAPTLQPYVDTQPRLISVDFAPSAPFDQADQALKNIIGHLPSKNFLLAYHTTPLVARSTSENGNDSGQGRPDVASPGWPADEAGEVPYESVFRNYQFFSPPLFMGLIVTGFLVVVFKIALDSVSALQISPAAFEPRRDAAKKKAT